MAILRAVVIAVAVTLAGAAMAQPAAKPATSKPGERKKADENGHQPEVEEKRPRHQRSLKKVRRGSYLRKDAPAPAQPDLRGEYERSRDYQMRIHFSRMARLDVIAEVASANDDLRLVHRVETVRRAEKERFRQAMNRIRAIARYKVSAGAR